MKCFYHSADLDGHCSGAIVKLNNPECEMIGINYGDDFQLDSILPKEAVYMVDFCLQPFIPHMTTLREFANLIWIDHHKTAIDEWKAASPDGKGLEIQGLREVGQSGCELTWEYFNAITKPPLHPIRLLGRYDVWDHSDPDVLPFQYGCRLYQTDPSTGEGMNFWRELFALSQLQLEVLSKGKTVLAYQKQQNKKMVESRSFTMEFDGLRVIACNAGLTNSQLFDSVYNPENHDAMMTFQMLMPGKWTVSIYSTKPDIDVGELCKKRGGGGHRGAAGFQCNELPF